MNIWNEVINTAIQDLKSGGFTELRDAHRFFFSPAFVESEGEFKKLDALVERINLAAERKRERRDRRQAGRQAVSA